MPLMLKSKSCFVLVHFPTDNTYDVLDEKKLEYKDEKKTKAIVNYLIDNKKRPFEGIVISKGIFMIFFIKLNFH